MKHLISTGACLLALTLLPVHAGPIRSTSSAVVRAQTDAPLANAVILIVRHGEKPDDGPDLAPAGQERAQAYVRYFEHFQYDSRPLHIDHIMASADTSKSHRERLTMEPLANALGLPIDTRFRNKDVDGVAQALAANPGGHVILICWHHGEIPALVQALGADSDKLFPSGKWPSSRFDMVIELPYDSNGHLMVDRVKRIDEHLMPGDH